LANYFAFSKAFSDRVSISFPFLSITSPASETAFLALLFALSAESDN